MTLSKIFPITTWGKNYSRAIFTQDLMAAIIVTVMLVPQSLAYALLAGLPPQMGLYASILPLILYAIFGTSRTLAVGPVAVLSLMTAAAAGSVAVQGSPEYIAAALILALLSGFFLLMMGVLRLGFLANFLSHPVISGFITASGIIIASSQVRHLFGVTGGGHTLLETLGSFAANFTDINMITVAIGLSALGFLFWVKYGLPALLNTFGVPSKLATTLVRTGPIWVVLGGIAVTASMGLEKRGIKIVGDIPLGLPEISMPSFEMGLWSSLVGSAFLICVLGFIESVSVAQTLAAKRRQRIDPNQELVALGAASVAAGLSGGYPVTGGFARSAVNFDAGAQTPLAGALTAIGIALASVFLASYLYFLPVAILSATIIVAVLSLVDFSAIRRTWAYSKSDFAAMAATILITLGAGVEVGLVSGVALSIFMHLYNTSRPHFAIVGQVPGTEHFRNVDRHSVTISNFVTSIRVDESLYFANARFLEDTVYDLVAQCDNIRHLVLVCPAVNCIDASGLDSLEAINQHLEDAGVTFHLSEVKGPVMDRLQHTDFLKHLSGSVYLHQYEAMQDLDPNLCCPSEQKQSGTKQG